MLYTTVHVHVELKLALHTTGKPLYLRDLVPRPSRFGLALPFMCLTSSDICVVPRLGAVMLLEELCI